MELDRHFDAMPSAVDCERALADCERRLLALKGSRDCLLLLPVSAKRARLVDIAANAMKALEVRLGFLMRELSDANKRDQRNSTGAAKRPTVSDEAGLRSV